MKKMIRNRSKSLIMEIKYTAFQLNKLKRVIQKKRGKEGIDKQNDEDMEKV